MFGRVLHRAIVGLILFSGFVGSIMGLTALMRHGAFDAGQLIGGPVQIVLAIWFLRGSDIARIVIAVLLALGFAVFAFALFVPYDPATSTLMLVMAIISAAMFVPLVFSQRLRAELASQAAKYKDAA